MGRTTNISWTDATLNLAYGCRKVDVDPLLGGCYKCYALDRVLPRMRKPSLPIFYPDLQKRIGELRSWKEVRIVFVNSLSDTFHEDIPFEIIEKWHREVFEAFPEKQFLLLTKRIGRAALFYRSRPVPRNVWVGCSIGQKARLKRLDVLRAVPARIRFVSFEPLLEDLGEFSMSGIQWAIVGGESDLKEARPMKAEWAENVRRICERYDVAFWFKQMGGKGGSGAGGDLLNGVRYQQWPKWQV